MNPKSFKVLAFILATVFWAEVQAAANVLETSRYGRNIRSVRFQNGDRLTVLRGDIPTVTLTKNNGEQFTSRKYSNFTVFELQSKYRGQFFSTFLKASKGSVITGTIPLKKNTKFFNTSPSDACAGTQIKSAIERLSSQELIEKISAIAVDDNINDSCSKVGSKNLMVFSEELTKVMNPQTSIVAKCLSSEKAQTTLSKYPKLESFAAQALASYLKETDDLANGTSKMEFGCFYEEKGRSAEIDISKPALNFLVKEGKISGDDCKSFDQIFAHEMFHGTGAPDPIPGQLDRICAESLGIKEVNDPKCSAHYPKADQNQGVEVTQAIKNVMDQETRAKVQPSLQSEIKVSEFKPVVVSDIDNIVSSQNPTAVSQSVNNVYQAMNSSLNSLSGSFSRAVTATTYSNRAIASETDIGAASTQSPRVSINSKSSSKSSKAKEYLVEEIVLDKYASNSKSVSPKKAGNLSEMDVRLVPDSANEVASNRTPASEVATNTPGISSSGTSSSQRPLRGSSSAAQRSPAMQGGSDIAERIAVLNMMNTLRGDKYQSIRSLYDNKEFIERLNRANISIQIGPRSLGSEQPRIKFIDSGVELKRIGR